MTTTTTAPAASTIAAAVDTLDPSKAASALSADDRSRIDEIKQTLNLSSSTSVLNFGAGSEYEVAQFADSVLEQVLGKDLGPVVHDKLTEIKFLAQGIKPGDLSGGQGFLGKLFYSANREITRFTDRFQSARAHIDSIARSLEDHIEEINFGLVVLDRLFEQNMCNFKELSLHVVAGHELLAHFRDEVLPQAEKGSQDLAEGQSVRDMKAAVDRLDRKVMNLEKSKAIAFAIMPTIRQVQQTSMILVEELKMALAHAIPAWKSTMVVYVEQLRQKAGLETLSTMTDFTDDQLRLMGEQLEQNAVDIQKQSQRGVADVQAITDTISTLIGAMDKVDQIEREAREARTAGRGQLAKAEADLRAVLNEAA